MKTGILSLLAVCLLLPQSQAEKSPTIPRLIGIVNLPDQKLILLEMDRPRAVEHTLILHEHERDGELEVNKINTASRSVELSLGGSNLLVHLPTAGSVTNKLNGFVLLNADIKSVFQLYAAFKNRTLLYSPHLPQLSLSLEAGTTNRNEAARILEKAFAAKGITTVDDGHKFVMVVPESEVTDVRPHAEEVESANDGDQNSGQMPTGSINFSNVDLMEAAQVYAALIGCKLDPTQRLTVPTQAINLKTQTSLSKAECIYALDALFSWQGLKVIRESGKLAKIVPITTNQK